MIKTVFFLLLPLTLFAKPFSIVLDKPFESALFDITEDYDRTISAIGISKVFQKHATQQSYDSPFEYLSAHSQSYGSQMHLVKLNPKNGALLLSKRAKLNHFNKAVSLEKNAHNGYFVGGYTMDGSLLVAKLDPNGKILQSQLFGTKNFDRMNKIILLSDGGILAIGSSTTSRNTQDDLFTTGLGNNDIFLTRFDKNLHMLWSKKYGTNHDDRGIDAAEAFDGSIVVIGTTSYEAHRDVVLMRISENGDRIWLKHFQGKTTTIPTALIATKDETFLAVVNEYDASHKQYVHLVRFDLYNNIVTDKKYKLPYSIRLNDITQFSDGSFMGVGSSTFKGNTDGFVMRFSSQLTLTHHKRYGDKNFDTLYAITPLDTMQAAAAGVYTPNNSQEGHMWVVKLNADGSLAH